jgi:hypothetical protein
MRPYCGPKNLKPTLAYTLFKDLNNGNFVLVRLHDPVLVSMLMGITQSDIIKDDENGARSMVGSTERKVKVR